MQGSPYRVTSPLLNEYKEAILHECPTGMLLREAPYVYDVIDTARADENCSPSERRHLAPYYHVAARLISSERERLRELKDSRGSVQSDANYGAAMLRRQG